MLQAYKKTEEPHFTNGRFDFTNGCFDSTNGNSDPWKM